MSVVSTPLISAQQAQEARRVLIINVTRIGDTILTTPAIRAIAKFFPNATLTVLGHPKRVEVLELHLTGKTDAAGYAKFDLPAGEYTLRAYDINRGGPPMLYLDTSVTITAGKELRIEVLDCLPCV